ncbi:uncharacterized protein PHALS_11553 [Plasmopara halstedii]|uniref:Uncharacterized protein n=1 Tax=Plasmopara halstedii TaxID=4781 RepID=A0A0P1AJM7_PLAHL|nr:uncharacterized protein PHALS_11553 [Plasmopara halstedii]CEG41189.1 hypothetical protein PHALS_11553 [Plasmopara halstedii]|eukprot:XP_024577558.1 hypothetical protein PHALS_11553 [Plasmopara halstedii]
MNEDVTSAREQLCADYFFGIQVKSGELPHMVDQQRRREKSRILAVADKAYSNDLVLIVVCGSRVFQAQPIKMRFSKPSKSDRFEIFV